MAAPSIFPAELIQELAADMAADAATQAAAAAVAREAATAAKPKRTLVTVEVTMPHVADYGREPTMRLTYGVSFSVEVGDTVLCPPTRLNPKWTKGVVTALEAGDYRGPVKYLGQVGAHRRHNAGVTR